MITPRQARLWRAPDLRTFQRVVVELALEGPPATCRTRAVLVPTRAAADVLRRTIEHHRLAPPDPAARRAVVLPDLVTRGEWYRRLAESLPGPPPLLTDLEREVLVARAARAADAEGLRPPFALRPGLVAALLGFYDELARRQRTVDSFEQTLVSSLEPVAEMDRGAARLLEATRFLAAVFRHYEAALEAHALYDEHRVRRRLLDERRLVPYRHVVVTVADEVVERGGLWPADFDLLSRVEGLARLDLVATEAVLGAGFDARVDRWWPGLEHARVVASERSGPVLLAPPADDGRRYTVHRDREEELAAVVRRAKAVARADGSDALDRMAVVFARPLPYVYLARQVCRGAGLPYQTFDALPLAAEPYAAALDLLFTLVLAGYTRQAIVGLLVSPVFDFAVDGRAVTRRDVAALDAVLVEAKFLGGREALARVAAELEGGAGGEGPSAARRRAAARAARAASAAVAALAPLEVPAPPSAHLAVLRAFLDRYERRLPLPSAWRERHLRARAAILGALDALAAAAARFDDAPQPCAAVAASLRRWIEAQTFTPRTGHAGLHLLDAAAARYGDFDEVQLVGLVDGDWPEPPPRSIFYPASLLVRLGWPAEAERRAGARAAFRDLLQLPRARVGVATFTLEHEVLARPSPLLEELDEVALPVVRGTDVAPARVFVHEALMGDPVAADAVSGPAARWLALRLRRSPLDAPIFRGATPPRGPEVYRVSAVERYLQCPFQYFAAHVLGLEEERDEEPGLTPQERGRLLHEVLRAFFDTWQRSGRGPITAESFAEAMDAFTRVADEALARLPDAERALERARLLGSAAAAGLAERVLAIELDDQAAVVERLLEYAVEGEFEFATPEERRRVRVRGKADRIDLLADGTLRVIDYKLKAAPSRDLAIQLPVYGLAAEQQLRAVRGESWRFAAAGYVAFGERRAFTPLAKAGRSFADEVAAGARRFVGAVDEIARGAFPVRPAQPFRCAFCPYPSVCRKDDVGDE